MVKHISSFPFPSFSLTVLRISKFPYPSILRQQTLYLAIYSQSARKHALLPSRSSHFHLHPSSSLNMNTLASTSSPTFSIRNRPYAERAFLSSSSQSSSSSTNTTQSNTTATASSTTTSSSQLIPQSRFRNPQFSSKP